MLVSASALLHFVATVLDGLTFSHAEPPLGMLPSHFVYPLPLAETPGKYRCSSGDVLGGLRGRGISVREMWSATGESRGEYRGAGSNPRAWPPRRRGDGAT